MKSGFDYKPKKASISVGTIIRSAFRNNDPSWKEMIGNPLKRYDYPEIQDRYPVGLFNATVRTCVEPLSFDSNQIVASPTYFLKTNNNPVTPNAGGLEYSTNSVNWSQTDIYLPNGVVITNVIFTGSRWVGVDGMGSGIYVTTGDNPNSTWILTNNSPQIASLLSYSPILGITLIFNGNSAACSLPDGSNDWSVISADGIGPMNNTEGVWTGDRFIYCGWIPNNNYIYSSFDGVTWSTSLLPADTGVDDINSIAANLKGEVVIMTWANSFNSKIYTSHDYGNTFKVVYRDVAAYSQSRRIFYAGNRFFANCNVSEDGENWQTWCFLPLIFSGRMMGGHGSVYAMAYKDGIFAASMSTVLVSALEDTTVFNMKPINEVTSFYGLYGPARPQTYIKIHNDNNEYLPIGSARQGKFLVNDPDYKLLDNNSVDRTTLPELSDIIKIGSLNPIHRQIFNLGYSNNQIIDSSPNFIVTTTGDNIGIQYSADNGLTWAQTDVSISVNPVSINELKYIGSRWLVYDTNSNIIYVTTGDNPNSTWIPTTITTYNGGNSSNPNAIVYSTSLGLALLVNGPGPYVYTLADGATDWVQVALPNSDINYAASSPLWTGFNFIVKYHNEEMLYSSQDGVTFIPVSMSDTLLLLLGASWSDGNGTIISAGMIDTYRPVLCVSKDFGQTWQIASAPIPVSTVIGGAGNFVNFDNNRIIISWPVPHSQEPYAALISDDGGFNWELKFLTSTIHYAKNGLYLGFNALFNDKIIQQVEDPNKITLTRWMNSGPDSGYYGDQVADWYVKTTSK